jgi:hypothetical protein
VAGANEARPLVGAGSVRRPLPWVFSGATMRRVTELALTRELRGPSTGAHRSSGRGTPATRFLAIAE